jgi:hypothetical protein
MNPSKQGTDKNQWSEWSSTSSASNRGEEFAEQQRYHAQHGLTVAAIPSYHDSFPRLADHTYRDFSTYIKDGNRIEKHKKSDRNFPARLHAMLSSEQYSHIISWMPHGRAWKVINKELLVEEAIPKFFGQSKFSSFTRQLSGWGFKRLHQTGQDFGCYYHECFLRGHPRLTVLMRRVPKGQGKATPNMHSEPDFYLIAKQYPLENSADALKKENEKVLRLEATSECEDNYNPLLTRKAAAPNMESISQQHQWDPFDQEVDSTHSTHREAAPEAAVNQYDAGNTNQSNKHSSQSHSFASAGVDTKEDEEQAESDVHEAMKYDPFPYQKQSGPGSYHDRGYSDPFPVSNYQLGPHIGYSMHPAHYEANMNRHYGSNVNQYAAFASQQAADAYYYPQPHHSQSQQHDVHSDKQASNYDYWRRHPYSYYNNHYSTQGVVRGDNQEPHEAYTAQLHYPGQGGVCDQEQLLLPSFKEKEEEGSKPQS